jgi:hypothetical protein
MKNILVSAISFVNNKRQGSDIYTTYANRLINDVLLKTPYDVMITTNEPQFFSSVKANNNSRVKIVENKLIGHKTHIGVFNQLLKFAAIKDIDKKYDWVLYLDCDSGFTSSVDTSVIDSKIDEWENSGFDMMALMVDRTYKWALDLYELSLINKNNEGLFNNKFKYYGVDKSLSKAVLPSEHILLIKNNDKLSVMCSEFEKLCTKFELQDEEHPVTYDMEAFEIGVSALLAGYNVGELGWGNQCEIFKVGFNGNNWEKIKR